MAFKKLGNLIPRHLQQAGISQSVQAAMVLEIANKKLEELFGNQVTSMQARAVALKYGRLQVATMNAALRHAISLQSQEIQEAVNLQVGKDLVKEIQLVI